LVVSSSKILAQITKRKKAEFFHDRENYQWKRKKFKNFKRKEKLAEIFRQQSQQSKTTTHRFYFFL